MDDETEAARPLHDRDCEQAHLLKIKDDTANKIADICLEHPLLPDHEAHHTTAQTTAEGATGLHLTPPPLWAYGILFMAVLAMASGGLWFALLTATPPLMKAGWRLMLTSAIQCFGFWYQVRHDKTLDAVFWLRFRAAIPQLGTVILYHSYM